MYQKPVRLSVLLVLVVGWIVLSSAPASALIVTTTSPLDTTQPPPDNPGWNNLTIGATTRNFTYLGNGWALSAWHVGPLIDEPPSVQTLTFSTGTFSIIPNQNYDVPNPSGSGLTPYTDLRLVRLNADPGLPNVTIASTPLTTANVGTSVADVTIIGQGRSREDNQSTWDGHAGYYGMTDNTKRWGKNQIVNEATIFSTETDADLRHTINLDLGGGITRDIVSMFTLFDNPGISYEAQAITGDSGSAVFRKIGSQWELIGIVNTMLSYQNQPVTFAAFGSGTSFADLTYYRNEILNIMNGHPNFSVVGDVNLDGVVSGDGTGAWATDDVTAFVQGWNWQQAQANVESWKKGDLNLDGVTNVSDFFLMRNALNTAGLGAGAAALGDLFSAGGVPEPSLLALVATALGCGIGCRRARRF